MISFGDFFAMDFQELYYTGQSVGANTDV